VLKLRKVDLLGFKSFCEKTQITFSGTGITCIVGPNGCGKSNIVDAISWVLGEQSHKLLRAERMADCIFNGTAKRPPLGLSEVSLTLVDPELAEAAAKVLGGPEQSAEGLPPQSGQSMTSLSSEGDGYQANDTEDARDNFEELPSVEQAPKDGRPWKKHGKERPVPATKPGEVVVGRRLYRSGQSEYLINGRVVRLRDIQELFMGMGLGPDSYAIIEQGRIGQILNSKPMDRRAIIEEAAGITMYKTKRRLAEAKLEASQLNLSRVNDILAEVEKQLASLKRQASKARRYAELREQMRGLLRKVLASKAQELDSQAERLEKILQELTTRESGQVSALRELETEQERTSANAYKLDTELRQTQNLLNQSALELDRAENRIAFNREQGVQLESRSERLNLDIDQAELRARQLERSIEAHREAVAALREQTANLEAALRDSLDRAGGDAIEQGHLEARIEELRQTAVRLSEEAVRCDAGSLQADEAAARAASSESERAEAWRALEALYTGHGEAAHAAEAHCRNTAERARELDQEVGNAQSHIAQLRQSYQQSKQRLDCLREDLSAERARCASLEQILKERAYTTDAVQKLFSTTGDGGSHGFRAVGLLADYAEVEAEYESAIEQFLHEELEYVVVETFDHARAGIGLLRAEGGGRATFFVDSLPIVRTPPKEPDHPLTQTPDLIAPLDRLIQFREPLGMSAKEFLPRLRSTFLVKTAAAAEKMARENPALHFLTLDGTCYHGRTVSGGRAGEARPLGLKRELRLRESETARLESIVAETQAGLDRWENQIAEAEEWQAAVLAQHVESEKSLVAATHQREQALADLRRCEQQLAACRMEIERLGSEASASRARASEARLRHGEALRAREAAEIEASAAMERLSAMREKLLLQQEQFASRREELAAMMERLASADATEQRLNDEAGQSRDALSVLRRQLAALRGEIEELAVNNAELARQAESFRNDKIRLEEEKARLDREWDEARSRAAQLDDALRLQRQSLDELRAERGQREIEKARSDSDRDYMRQICNTELNAQPEELIGLEPELLAGEALAAAENSYDEMKARVESMGPVNMMALEEYRECEERDTFLRRERDDLVQSIENTRQAIAELDMVSRQKFEAAFTAINRHFATAFQSLFGGGHGEMRLTEPDSSGECGIDIVAQPPGKRLQNLLLLSGGEKALTALGLLIAVFRFQPSPFCILDEVDAPLDEANVGRFNKMLLEMGEQTQFIVVTHNRRTMEMGAVLYGVTMQEPGVSKLVSVRWEDQAEAVHTATNAA
jgi:chromosome segregation protein